MADHETLVGDALSLMQRAMLYYDPGVGFGTMSCAPYDTAWVALVAKEIDGQKQYLFPECFDYLLATQSSSGGWTENAEAAIDGILNTAGPLLALKRHASNPLQLNHDIEMLEDRISKATVALRAQLAVWDVSLTEHVGFEIIVPAMLDLLEQEDKPLVFDFGAKALLMKINQAKISLFRPEYLYGKHRMTTLYSLESFIGKIDFDKVSHHKSNGSMLSSPSSTAAYLMHSSQWDDESEAYLRQVIKFGAGQNSGAIPSAFPSTYFEASWVLSTLLRAGFTPAELESADFRQMTDILRKAFECEGGVIGFAPYIEPDADDSGKIITCLSKLGYTASPSKLIEVFEAPTHFRTYAIERDPSLTANCNALIALLSDASACASQIIKITKFLCEYWWATDGKIKDKWHTSYLYPSMLLVQSLTDVLQALECGKLPSVFDDDAKSRLAITLFQACFRPLLDQKTNGSWNNSIEETAYGILNLSESRRLHLFEDLRQPIDEAISRGVAFLESNKDQPDSRVWVTKVSYSSLLVMQAYRLAAMRVASTQIAPSVGSSVWNKSQASGLHKHVELFSQAPLFSQLPRWELHGSMVEAALFATLLRTHRSAVFNRIDLEEDKYFDVIPFFLTSSNNRARTYASTNFLFEMSRVMLLNFQVDEFMEATAGPTFDGRFDDLRDLIRDMLADDRPVPIISNKSTLNGTKGVHERNGVHNSHNLKPLDLNDRDPGYVQVFTHLSKFLNYILQHQYVQAASAWDQQLLRRELKTYLLGHTQQAEDSSRSGKACQPVSTSTTTFFNWVRTTSADHVSIPYTFAFVTCFMGFTLTPRGGSGDCFPSATEKYLANAACRHLSTMCRMYNDVGSIERDQSEGNLNSVDFPEFGTYQDMKSKQKALLSLGKYERQAYKDAFARLEQANLEVARENADTGAVRLAERRMDILTMFCEHIDLYGQVYVVRDMSSRVLGGEQPVAKAVAAV